MYSRKQSLFSLASAALLMFLTVVAQADTWYVTTDGNDSNDGLAPATSFATIQCGIDAASDGDTVLVASGYYYQNDIDFKGKAITVQSQDRWGAIVLGSLGFSSGRGFLFHNNETSASRLDGFVISGHLVHYLSGLEAALDDTLFNAPGQTAPISAGAGIRIIDSSPTISNCAITQNYAEAAGSAIGVSGGAPRLLNCVFGGNFSYLGTIYSENSDLTIVNSLFFSNQSLIAPAVFANSGKVNMINCSVAGDLPGEGSIFGLDPLPTGLQAEIVGGPDSEVLVGNSILWHNATLMPLYSVGLLTVNHSNIQGSGGSANWQLGGIVDAGGNIDADPWPGGFPIPLPLGSPCIDAADPALYNAFAADVTYDLLGHPRLIGTSLDMGCVEADTIKPVISVPSNIAATATSASGAVVTFTATANDNIDGPVAVTCTPASGSVFPLGTTTVTCTAKDAAGNEATETFTVSVTYSWSGFLQPINADGSSVFKAGSTVAVKFQLTGASAPITDAVARFSATRIGSNSGTVNETTSTGTGDSGNTFRYDATSKLYIYNWGTKGLTAGIYQLCVDLGDGVTRTVNVGLR